jgi:hypothetical protein
MPVGHKDSDHARDQVFLRVRSTCSASAAPMGIQAVQWTRHLFSQHCLATPEPMSHLRMGECIAASWGGRRAIRTVSNFPAGRSIPKPRGVARSSKLVLGFRAGLTVRSLSGDEDGEQPSSGRSCPACSRGKPFSDWQGAALSGGFRVAAKQQMLLGSETEGG